MAESIYGEDFNIHFTNGGGETLFESLILLGRKLPEEKILGELLDYLRYSLDNFGYGCRLFNLESLPDKLNFKHLAEYARLVDLLCLELTKADSKLEETIFENLESRMSWLARLMNLYSLIEKQLAKTGVEIPVQNILLSPEEAVTVERQRLVAVYEKTNYRVEKAERVKQWEKIVELSEKDKISMSLLKLSLVYIEYTDLIDETFPKEKQRAIWQRCLEIETELGEEEGVEIAKEFLEEIEKE